MSPTTSALQNASYSYPPPAPVFWWLFQMEVFSVFNCCMYMFMFVITKKNVEAEHAADHKWSYWYCMAVRFLPLPYVFECTWRSFLPTQYNKRLVVYDTSASSILLERLLAFFGEVSWGTIMGLCLAVISHAVPLRGSERVSSRIRTVIPMVGALMSVCALTANICSNIGTVTTDVSGAAVPREPRRALTPLPPPTRSDVLQRLGGVVVGRHLRLGVSERHDAVDLRHRRRVAAPLAVRDAPVHAEA